MNSSAAKVSAAVLFAATLSACLPTVPLDVCAVAQDHSLVGRRVRIKGEGIFSAHGASLMDRRCPNERVFWSETEEFRRSAAWDELGSAVFRERYSTFRNIEVDVTGVLRTNSDGHLELTVDQLHSFHAIDTPQEAP